jgi:hypothetical protein
MWGARNPSSISTDSYDATGVNSIPLTNYGTITNNGTFLFNSNFSNYGIVVNNNIVNLSGIGNQIDNYTTFTNNGTFTNSELVNNMIGGSTFTNTGTIANSGTIFNYSTFTNNNLIANTGNFTNYDHITNTAQITNNNGISNNGAIFVNAGGSKLTNTIAGTITNGIIADLTDPALAISVSITNAGFLLNYGNITNYNRFTVDISGIIANYGGTITANDHVPTYSYFFCNNIITNGDGSVGCPIGTVTGTIQNNQPVSTCITIPP